LSLPRRHLVEPGDPLHPLTVAASLLHVPENEIELVTKTINTGASSHGVYLHTARTAKSRPIRFIEKRPKKDRELRFFATYYDRIARDGSVRIPKVFRAGSVDGAALIYMQYVRGVMTSPSEIGAIASPLGESIASISCVELVADPSVRPVDHLQTSLLDAFADLVARTTSVECLDSWQKHLAELRAMRDDLRGLVQELPLCLVHADIFFENIAVTNTDVDRGKQVTFLDWGDYGIDRLGADLHHFSGAVDKSALFSSKTYTGILGAYQASIAANFGYVEKETLALSSVMRRFARKATNALNRDSNALPAALTAAGTLVTFLSSCRPRSTNPTREGDRMKFHPSASSIAPIEYFTRHREEILAAWSEIQGEGYAADYQHITGPFAKMVYKGLTRFAGRSVLDIGCNTGQNTLAVSFYASEVIGCDEKDLSIRRAMRAKQIMAREFDMTRVQFAHGDVSTFLNDRIDAILACKVLYWVGDENIFRLRDFLLNRTNFRILIHTVPNRGVQKTKAYNGMFDIEDVKTFLTDAGFNSFDEWDFSASSGHRQACVYGEKV
jgi:SAM-dependent methyltransferase